MAKRATITDVARKAGFSAMTVSRVVRNDKHVKDSTRRRIIQTISQLNYHPNFSARALSSHVTGNIGFLINRNSYYSDYLSHLVFEFEDELFSRDYSIIICVQPPNPTHIPIIITQRKIDGLITVGYEVSSGILSECSLNKIPVVMIEGKMDSVQVVFIHSDFEQGVSKAVEHLWRQGRSSFAFIGQEPKNSNEQRLLAQLQKTITTISGSRSAIHPFWTNGTGIKGVINRKPGLPRQASAIFCSSDLLASGVSDALMEQGVNIPEDIALVGYGDTQLARIKHPHFSSIAVDKKQMASMAIELLFKQINKKEIQPRQIYLPTLFIQRESSGRQSVDKNQKEVVPNGKSYIEMSLTN